LPEEVSYIDEGFNNLGFKEKYQRVLRIGHVITRLLLNDIKSRSLRDPNGMRDDQTGLTEIIHDEHTLTMFKETAAIFPSLRILEEEGNVGVFGIDYKPNERYRE